MQTLHFRKSHYTRLHKNININIRRHSGTDDIAVTSRYCHQYTWQIHTDTQIHKQMIIYIYNYFYGFSYIFSLRGHSEGHYWVYPPGALSFKSSHCNSFEDRAPVDSSTGAWSSNELQWLDYTTGSRDGCLSVCPTQFPFPKVPTCWREHAPSYSRRFRRPCSTGLTGGALRCHNGWWTLHFFDHFHIWNKTQTWIHIDGSGQHCGNSSALAMGVPQPCAEP